MLTTLLATAAVAAVIGAALWREGVRLERLERVRVTPHIDTTAYERALRKVMRATEELARAMDQEGR